MAVVSADKRRSYDGDYMETGREGEEIVLDWLRDRPHLIGVQDFRELKPVQAADVDCGLELRLGGVTLAEIKTDTHLGASGNVLCEVLRINHTACHERACVLGWTMRTPATYLLWYAPTVNAIYECKTADLRRELQRYTDSIRRDNGRLLKQFRTVNTDQIKTTVTILLPWAECQQAFHVHALPEKNSK